ncbi:MAG: hypothetical protein ACRDRY_17790 [Pseudonocardiaceae bacterium]
MNIIPVPTLPTTPAEAPVHLEVLDAEITVTALAYEPSAPAVVRLDLTSTAWVASADAHLDPAQCRELAAQLLALADEIEVTR